MSGSLCPPAGGAPELGFGNAGNGLRAYRDRGIRMGVAGNLLLLEGLAPEPPTCVEELPLWLVLKGVWAIPGKVPPN